MNYPEPDKRLPVAFDFDGTLAIGIWPEPGIGEPIWDGLRMLQHYQDKGYRVLIHTSRAWHAHPDIERWLKQRLGADRMRRVQIICGKPLAGLYIDDRGHKFERSR
jgi:hypothetical protein